MIISRLVGDKRRYRQYKARTRRLPDDYRTVAQALERYVTYLGGSEDADSMATMLEDLVDLFEQSAASGTPIREVVGQDPVEFADEFLRNYPKGHWIERERDRLTQAVDRAAEDQARRGR